MQGGRGVGGQGGNGARHQRQRCATLAPVGPPYDCAQSCKLGAICISVADRCAGTAKSATHPARVATRPTAVNQHLVGGCCSSQVRDVAARVAAVTGANDQG